MDINYHFADFKCAEGHVNILDKLNYYKYVKGLLMHMQTTYIHCSLPCDLVLHTAPPNLVIQPVVKEW